MHCWFSARRLDEMKALQAMSGFCLTTKDFSSMADLSSSQERECAEGVTSDYIFLQGATDRQAAQYLQATPESRAPAVAYEGLGGAPLLRQSPQAGASSGQEDELLLGHHLLDFWTNICVCHNLITEENAEGGPPVYQVTLPSLQTDPGKIFSGAHKSFWLL